MFAAPPVPRRRFLGAAAAALAAPAVASPAFAAPLYVRRGSFGANDRVATAHVGVGGQGKGNLGRFLAQANAQPVVVRDADAGHAAEAAALAEKQGAAVETVADYRDLLSRDDVDAFVVSTPDHWHALPTIHACEAGKDVYCEKPLTLTVAEGRRMVDAARAHGRVVQTGSQQRSSREFRRACELVRSGAVGELTEVLVGIPGPNHPGEPVPDEPPPADLDYDRWLGPAPERPYNPKRVHYNFRFFRDYSGGQLTNWGAHHLDIARWGLGDADDAGPTNVRGTGTFHPDGWHEVTETCAVEYDYPGGVTVKLSQKTGDCPTRRCRPARRRRSVGGCRPSRPRPPPTNERGRTGRGGRGRRRRGWRRSTRPSSSAAGGTCGRRGRAPPGCGTGSRSCRSSCCSTRPRGGRTCGRSSG